MPLDVRRRVRAQAPCLRVLALVLGVGGSLTIAPSHWRRATALIAFAMLLAAAMRLLLPASLAGLLAVRGRWWDSFCFLALGAVILIVDVRLRS